MSSFADQYGFLNDFAPPPVEEEEDTLDFDKLVKRRLGRFFPEPQKTAADYERELMDAVGQIQPDALGEEKRSALGRAFNLIDMPRNVVANLANQFLGVKPSAPETGTFGIPQVTGGDIVEQKLGVKNPIAKFALGLPLDIAMDPLSWLSFGLKPAASAIARGVGGASKAGAAANAAEHVLTFGLRKGLSGPSGIAQTFQWPGAVAKRVGQALEFGGESALRGAQKGGIIKKTIGYPVGGLLWSAGKGLEAGGEVARLAGKAYGLPFEAAGRLIPDVPIPGSQKLVEPAAQFLGQFKNVITGSEVAKETSRIVGDFLNEFRASLPEGIGSKPFIAKTPDNEPMTKAAAAGLWVANKLLGNELGRGVVRMFATIPATQFEKLATEAQKLVREPEAMGQTIIRDYNTTLKDFTAAINDGLPRAAQIDYSDAAKAIYQIQGRRLIDNVPALTEGNKRLFIVRWGGEKAAATGADSIAAAKAEYETLSAKSRKMAGEFNTGKVSGDEYEAASDATMEALRRYENLKDKAGVTQAFDEFPVALESGAAAQRMADEKGGTVLFADVPSESLHRGIHEAGYLVNSQIRSAAKPLPISGIDAEYAQRYGKDEYILQSINEGTQFANKPEARERLIAAALPDLYESMRQPFKSVDPAIRSQVAARLDEIKSLVGEIRKRHETIHTAAEGVTGIERPLVEAGPAYFRRVWGDPKSPAGIMGKAASMKIEDQWRQMGYLEDGVLVPYANVERIPVLRDLPEHEANKVINSINDAIAAAAQVKRGKVEAFNAALAGVDPSIAGTVERAVKTLNIDYKSAPLHTYLTDPITSLLVREQEAMTELASVTFANHVFKNAIEEGWMIPIPRGRKLDYAAQLPMGFTELKMNELKSDLFKGVAEQLMQGHDISAVWMPSAEADALKSWFRFMKKPGPVLKFFDRMQGIWKGMVLTSPGYHFRNIATNTALQMFGGGFNEESAALGHTIMANIARHGGDLEQLQNAVIKGVKNESGQLYNQADFVRDLSVKYPVLGHDMISVDSGADLAGAGISGTRLQPEARKGYKRALSFLDWNRATSMFVEDGAKVGFIIERMKQGDSMAEAVLKAKKFLYDPSELTAVERSVFRRVIPFYSWLRKNTEMLIRVAATRPQMLAMVPKVRTELEQAIMGDQAIPSQLRPQLAVQEGGIQVTGGPKPQFFNLPGFLPVKELGMLVSPKQALDTIQSGVTPALRLPYELLTNQNTFYGRPIQEYPGQRVPFLGVDMPAAPAYMARQLLGPLQQVNRLTQTDVPLASRIGRTVGLRTFGGNVLSAVESQSREIYAQKSAVKQDILGALRRGDRESAAKLIEAYGAISNRISGLPIKEASRMNYYMRKPVNRYFDQLESAMSPAGE